MEKYFKLVWRRKNSFLVGIGIIIITITTTNNRNKKIITITIITKVFALHHFKPTPLYVMDEIDAALDFKNVAIIGKYIKERTKNAQVFTILMFSS